MTGSDKLYCLQDSMTRLDIEREGTEFCVCLVTRESKERGTAIGADIGYVFRVGEAETCMDLYEGRFTSVLFYGRSRSTSQKVYTSSDHKVSPVSPFSPFGTEHYHQYFL